MYFTTEPHLQSIEAAMRSIPRYAINRIEDQEGEKMKLRFSTKEHYDRFLSLFRMKRTNPLRSEPEFVAAIYILTADPELWDKVKDNITNEKINFRKIRLGSVSTDTYALYKTAEGLFYNKYHVAPNEVRTMDCLSDLTKILILISVKVAKNGFGYIETDKFGFSGDELGKTGVIKRKKRNGGEHNEQTADPVI